MKVKTSELTRAALDWAVARCEVDAEFIGEIDDPHFYSTDWALAGPIIEREGIQLRCGLGGWVALPYDSAFSEEAYQEGDTPLIAAMRCYVSSKLGDEIETPEGLNQEQTT